MKIEYQCKYCHYSTDNLEELEKHIKEKHGIVSPFTVEPDVEVWSPDIEVGLTIYLSKMMNAPVKVKLISYSTHFNHFKMYIVMPRVLSFEQVKGFSEVREHFSSIDRASTYSDKNYIKYPLGGVDIIYYAIIEEDELKKILNSV